MRVSVFKNSRVSVGVIVYWGILLFGYDTGIGGGVVSAPYFLETFDKNQKKIDEVSGNVVAVLQAGAFFGALSSAPISCTSHWSANDSLWITTIFVIGAILTTIAAGPPHGLALIYGGRVLSGYGIGAISAVAPAYVSECSPKDVRGRITGMFQIMVKTESHARLKLIVVSYFVNYAIGAHVPTGYNVWLPAGIMVIGLFFVKESPRWLAQVGRDDQALANLAYLRKEPQDSPAVMTEFAEIQAALKEEREARAGLGWKEAFTGKGNFIRFVIAFVIFLLQQFAGQNSVNYYAPQIFASIGYTGRKSSLLASIIKVVATAIFIFFGVESLGRKMSLIISALGMGTLFFIIGAILKTHPPPRASIDRVFGTGMAAMLYIYVCFYSMGWGPLPWVYVSDIFPTRTRHYGLIFMMFATINILAMGTFSALIPETKGRSLEEMDLIFGSVTAEERNAHIRQMQNEQGAENDSDKKGRWPRRRALRAFMRQSLRRHYRPSA
ncbi:sugar transporter [Coprinopsis sp. MPI-PUGE-AT-0042]|nr:sugar transporter [Coprinopsis sp. MPI-PUGE-AT-0042]